MKTRFVLALIIATVAAVLMTQQIKMVNAAPQPITSPISGPTLTPVPSIVTPTPSPVTYYSRFILSGSVSYRYIINRFFNFTRPASRITVEAVNLQTKEKYTTKTSWWGSYNFSLKKGTYRITAIDSAKTAFNPFSRNVNLFRNTFNINFTGLLRFR